MSKIEVIIFSMANQMSLRHPEIFMNLNAMVLEDILTTFASWGKSIGGTASKPKIQVHGATTILTILEIILCTQILNKTFS